jgi:hypothetical protein
MTALQMWIVIGVPALVAVLVLLVGGDAVRARIALGVLVALAVIFVIAPGTGGASVAVVAVPAIVLIAGGRLEGPTPPAHHEGRRRYTTVEG